MDLTARRTFLAGLLCSVSMRGQQEAYVPKQSDRPEPLQGEEPGFQPMFDGRTLNGWDYDPRYWRVENGVLTGEVTPETILQRNTFIIWKGGSPKDFELKVDYRITAGGNSGINYRSRLVPDVPLALRGYQCDIDGRNAYTGNNYEERGRLFLGVRGQVTRVTGDRKPVILSSLGDGNQLAGFLTTDWNSVHLIVRGNTMLHMINGHTMCVVVDDDARGRSSEGLIGVQVHVGPPMKVEYRNFRLKTM
jgi:hypothetical protein